MSKLDEIIARHGAKDPFFRMYGSRVKQQIKDLMLELIGEDVTHWTDHWGDEHNVPTDHLNSQNELRADLRKKIEEL